MQITVTPEQEALIRHAIQTGRLDRPEDAVTEALLLWEEREMLRSSLIASLEKANASIERGEGRMITEESMQALAEEAKQRLRARLAAERSPSP